MLTLTDFIFVLLYNVTIFKRIYIKKNPVRPCPKLVFIYYLRGKMYSNIVLIFLLPCLIHSVSLLCILIRQLLNLECHLMPCQAWVAGRYMGIGHEHSGMSWNHVSLEAEFCLVHQCLLFTHVSCVAVHWTAWLCCANVLKGAVCRAAMPDVTGCWM